MDSPPDALREVASGTGASSGVSSPRRLFPIRNLTSATAGEAQHIG